MNSHTAKTIKIDGKVLSLPPTKGELENLPHTIKTLLPQTYYRMPSQRIFVNRRMRLDTVSAYGFDMDYTLVDYKSPAYEELGFSLIMEQLVQSGYPRSILNLKYDPNYLIRGLFLDTQLGNFLKADGFGRIVLCVHGKTHLPKAEFVKHYPGLRIVNSQIGKRFYLLTTAFSVTEASVYASLIMHLEEEKNKTDLVSLESSFEELSYLNIWQDVRKANDIIHLEEGPYKQRTLQELDKYVHKSPELSKLLIQLKQANKKLFLITNSPWNYTNDMLSYLLNNIHPDYKTWLDYFDIVIVLAEKPNFFGVGSQLRGVNKKTGQLKINKTKKGGKIYQGGNVSSFVELINLSEGENILYCGDHIFADIIVPMKRFGWRNLLIVKELKRELQSWEKIKPFYDKLLTLEYIKSETYREMDISSSHPPDISDLKKAINQTHREIDNVYNPVFGSLFRSGLRSSFFANQVQRYSDLYSEDYLNLINYPLFYYFSAPVSVSPHELPFTI